MTFPTAIFLSGVAGFLAVAAGTFGAHGLEGRVHPDLVAIFEVAVRYHAYHALAILICAVLIDRIGRGVQVAIWCFVIGIVVFSGSLYALALTQQHWLGAITPIGGISFLAGWLALMIGGAKSPGGATEAR